MSTGQLFVLHPCTGPCLVSAEGRRRIGCQPGDMLRITSGNSSINRLANKVPKQALALAGLGALGKGLSISGVLWVNIDDFRLLGIMPGDTAIVERSSEPIECP